jgi:uncharacterized protein
MTSSGEKDLRQLLKMLKPKHNEGEFVFCVVEDLAKIPVNEIVMLFKEEEGMTAIIRKELADHLQLPYSFVAAWITLTVHSSLEAVGLTASFSNALAEKGIGCNVVAAFCHDHIFVDQKDLEIAMKVLRGLSGNA